MVEGITKVLTYNKEHSLNYNTIWIPHIPYRHCSPDATHLFVRNTSKKTIPKYIFLQFRYVKEFKMNKQNLTSVTVEDFGSADYLEHLDLSRNKLEKFPSYIFRNTPKITIINLSHNRLQTMDFRKVTRPDIIHFIYLNNNRLTTIPLGIDQMRNLMNIKLFRNHIKTIDLNQFDLKAPTVIRLNNNQIRRITNNASVSHSDIKYLDISNNPINDRITVNVKEMNISATNAVVCEIKSNVVTLIASHNRIDRIILNFRYRFSPRFKNLRSLNNLLYLDLSKNHLSSISNLTVLNNLVELDLSYNVLRVIDESVFSQMDDLEKLNLRGNHLIEVTFGTLFSLNFLDVSHNQLQKIHMTGILPELQSLLIEGNPVQKFENSTFW